VIEARIKVSSPSSAAIASFYDEYGSLAARRVATKGAAPWWLGGKRTGLAISSVAPDSVLQLRAGKWSTVAAAAGHWRVKALGAAAPLAAFPLAAARPAIAAALRQSAKTNAYQSWTAAKQRFMLKQTSCRRDALPAAGAVDLTSYLPFLAL
jgi:hypothetical protein